MAIENMEEEASASEMDPETQRNVAEKVGSSTKKASVPTSELNQGVSQDLESIGQGESLSNPNQEILGHGNVMILSPVDDNVIVLSDKNR
ncbi:hypothetical protein Ancab_016147 [Ancistrocladus abbreviatus]